MSSRTIVRLKFPNTQRRQQYFSFYLQSKMGHPPSQYNVSRNLIFICSISSGFAEFRSSLIENGVIDRHHRWIFDDGHLVILGDSLEHSEHFVESLWLIYSLEEKAMKKGGYVHFIFANESRINTAAHWRYIHPNYANPESSKSGLSALYDGNNTIWTWLTSKNIVEKIGDILVCDSSILSRFDLLSYSISEINTLARLERRNSNYPLEKLPVGPNVCHGFETINEQQVNSLLEHFQAQKMITTSVVLASGAGQRINELITLKSELVSPNTSSLLIKADKILQIDESGQSKAVS